MKLEYSEAAVADIDQIWDYTFETWGLEQAERYVRDIREICEDLAQGQKVGRSIAHRPDFLRYVVGRHVIFLKERGDGITVVRVLHQQMDTDRHL